MNGNLSPAPSTAQPTRVRYGVLAFACVLSMITYLDRVCFGQVAPYVQHEFGLTESEVGYLFTAFALSYALFEIPTGWLGDVFGPKRTLIRIVLWWSAFTALTGAIYPTPAQPLLGFVFLLCVRFLFGMGEAGAYPNIARSFHNWFPFGERGFAKGAVWMAGRFAGGITPFVVLALVYHNNEVTHWRHIFWAFGVLGVTWSLAFWWFFRDRPEEHVGVNASELAYIRDNVAPAAVAPVKKPVPWGRLLTNGNLWLLCLMYFCASYGWYFNITWLPKYLNWRYNANVDTEGFWTFSLLVGAPLLLGSLACLCGGLLTDLFIRRTGDRKWGRRLFGIVGHGACAVCYFFALLANSAYLFVLAIALAAFCNDLTMGSAWASCLDIGKRYAGIVSGCMNTIGNLGGAVAGFSTGLVLDYFIRHHGDAVGKDLGWRVNLISYAGVYVLAVILWLRFDATRPVAEDAEG